MWSIIILTLPQVEYSAYPLWAAQSSKYKSDQHTCGQKVLETWNHRAASQWLDFTNDKTFHHKVAKLGKQKRRGKEGHCLLSDNQEKLGVHLGYVRLLAQKTKRETQVARVLSLGMSNTF